ncbi:MAG TPA: RDD family protein [Gaiellaceae bacterium]|nr:RDD family protein [Gaiellaceae bacterium]
MRRSRLGAAGRLAFFPARVAARASRAPLEAAADDHLIPELSRLTDHALAGPLPEELARSVIEHHVLERMVAAGGDLDVLLATALDSPRMKELTDKIVRSDEFRGAMREILASPEVRAALTVQTTGLFGDLLAELRRSAVRMDGAVERALRRPARAAGNVYAGIVTRAIALAVDALLIVVIFTVLSGFVALITSLVGTLRPAWLVGLLLGVGGAIVSAGYLILFWSSAGRTPGMGLLRLRVRRPGGGPPSVARATVRTFGTWLAIIPLFAGYLPVLFDRRRRGLPDYLAQTEVVYDDRASTPASG